ncbi:AI-2E family transporter [Vampirovibrio chlorellavorus]|uniref:AI-2E family transporter n=1 Tax=Vampirovibrio chlorellavorus TaxID=758823 RepID=UPI0026EEFA6A|nr:AI-2E family transporter [Vampirovibrio chlorellavorus]
MSKPPAPEASTSATGQAVIFSPLTRLNLFILCLVFLAYVGVSLTERLPAIIAMLAASLILTYLLLSPVQWLEATLQRLFSKQKKIPTGMAKVLAIALVYLVGLSLFGLTVLQIATPLSLQIKGFARDIPQHLNKANPETLSPENSTVTTTVMRTEPATLSGSTGWGSPLRQATAQSSKARILSGTRALVTQKFTGIFKNYAAKLGRYVLDIGTTALSSIIYILTTLVLTFYLLLDGKTLQQGLINLMPNRHEAAAKQFLTRLHRQFYTVVKGQVLMSFLSGGLMYAALLILGVKYALLLGVVLGGVSILPVIGPWLGLLPIIAVVEMGGNPIDILPVLLVAGCFYLLKAYWLWPRLVSRKFDLHPILFILTFLMCTKIMGFSGIFLSFPMASVVGVWMDIQKARHSKAYLTRNP